MFALPGYLGNRNALDPVGVVPFDPVSLFAGAEDGFWIDASDLTKLWQTSTFTTQVTADNDPIGSITDKSGKTNNIVRATGDTQRALYKTSGGLHWMLFDGTNDAYTHELDLTNAIGALTFAVALRVDSTKTTDMTVVMWNTNSNGLARASMEFPTTSNIVRGRGRRVDGDAGVNNDYASFADDVDCVVLIEYNWTATDNVIYLNQTAVATNSSWLTSGNTSATNSSETVFGAGGVAVGSAYLKGRVYQALAIDRILTAGERGNLITYFGAKAGITI